MRPADRGDAVAWGMLRDGDKDHMVVIAVHGNRITTRTAQGRWVSGTYKDQQDTDKAAADMTGKMERIRYSIVAGPVVFTWPEGHPDAVIHATIMGKLKT
jgi:hypothetical protein